MSAHAESNPIAHVASVKSLLVVFAALVALTVLTVWQGTQLELGSWELLVVLAIAAAKSTLVILFFMHMLYDKPLNAIAFSIAILFVVLFIGLTLGDVLTYQPDVAAMEADVATERAALAPPPAPTE